MLRVTPRRPVPSALAAAGHALEEGEPVLIFDAPDREGETDLVFLSEKATPELVRLARKDAGGLVCTAISEELRRRLDLPFYSELLALAGRSTRRSRASANGPATTGGARSGSRSTTGGTAPGSPTTTAP